jgi:hypothetical protein
LPLLCVAAFGGTLVLGRKAIRSREAGSAGYLLAVVLLATAFFFIASLLAQKALWARHYAPVFPFYLTALALFVQAAWQRTGPVFQRTAVAGLIGLLILSSISLRFAARHQKDDYRSAAAAAIRALQAGKTVWWAAGPETAEYYRVPLSFGEPHEGRAFCPLIHTGLPDTKATGAHLHELATPDVIILSKPDTFDVFGTVTACIEKYHFQPVARFKTFTVWAAPGSENWLRQ